MTIQDPALCWESIAEVTERGYAIDTSTNEAFLSSLIRAKQKVSHMTTKAESKRKELERRFGRRDKKSDKLTVYDAVGSLEIALGFSVGNIDSLTLAHYNALKKGAKERESAKKASSELGNRINGKINSDGRD
jgi:hypothetical protein